MIMKSIQIKRYGGNDVVEVNKTASVPSISSGKVLVNIIEQNFQKMDFDYCPGEYWPDNKTGNHTLIIFATEQPHSNALAKLKKMIGDNVYV